MAYKILVLKGDGIGPEVVGEALQVLKVVARNAALDLEFKEGTAGGHAIDQFGTPLPDDVLKLAKDSDAILFGAVGGPNGTIPNPTSVPSRRCSRCARSSGCSPTCGRSRRSRN
jgi:isocitrate/isopropylmalate dehydrogenase